MINTTTYSYAAQAFPKELQTFIGLLEGISGVGITLSPILGVFIYNAVGFSNTFLIFGLAMAPVALVLVSLRNHESRKSWKAEKVRTVKTKNRRLNTSMVQPKRKGKRKATNNHRN